MPLSLTAGIKLTSQVFGAVSHVCLFFADFIVPMQLSLFLFGQV